MAVDQWIGGVDGKFVGENGNWKSGTAIANGDAVVVPKTAAQNIDDSLDGSAVTLVGFETEKDAEIEIGKWSAAALAEYCKITLLHSAAYYDAVLRGSGETFLHVTNSANIFVHEAPAASSSNFGLNLQALNDETGDGKVFITAKSGTVGLAANPDEIFEAEEINIDGANVVVGEGVCDPDGSAALVLLNARGGTVVCRAAVATLNVISSNFTHENGAITTLNLKAGKMTVAGALTITTANVRAGTKLDMTGDIQAKTITTITMAAGSTLDIRGGHVTITNPIVLDGCAVQDVTVLADPEAAVRFVA